MTLADTHTIPHLQPERMAFWIKWIASVFQKFGYGATGPSP